MAWIIWGILVFGFVVGLLTGMSKTPAIGGVVPLLFTFAGGSIITLSLADGRTAEDLDLVGQELVAFSFGVLAGALLGALLRRNNVDLPLTGRAD